MRINITRNNSKHELIEWYKNRMSFVWLIYKMPNYKLKILLTKVLIRSKIASDLPWRLKGWVQTEAIMDQLKLKIKIKITN